MSHAERFEWTDWTLTRITVRGISMPALVCEGREGDEGYALAVAPLCMVTKADDGSSGLADYLGSILEGAARASLS